MERIVHSSEKGMRLDRFLRIHAPRAPTAAVLLKQGRLTVDGRKARASDVLAAGQVVRLAEPAKRAVVEAGQAAGPSPVERDLLARITLFEDDDLIVFDKPSGLAVHRGTRTTEDLDSILAKLVDAEGERPRLVHRLDKDTSGLLVAAKHGRLAESLGRAFASRAVEKTYLAVVEGVPEPPTGRIATPLEKVATAKGGRMVAAAPDDPRGLSAATGWEVVETAADGRSSLVAFHPESGRQHQLRIHAKLLGHPILGDRLYGDGRTAPRLMLHAHRLVLPDGRGGKREFVAPTPEGFARGG
ncbi:RluA family pseudouridine synthase [Pinisolibacter sp.]|uniref:RluA family pseudouridine synthase n=1 Tax=Pinisolibacter sp. TaxID=2172024 RepID=UPI002FDD512C